MESRLTKPEMLMAMVGCISLLWVAGNWAFLSVPLTLGIVASWYIPQRYSATPSQQRMAFTIMGLPFLVLGLYNFVLGGVVGFQRIGLTGAMYVLAGAVLELYREPEQARPAVFHAGIATVLLIGGLTRANPYYLYFLLAYALGLIGLLTRPVSGMIGGPKSRSYGKRPTIAKLLCFALAIPIAIYYFSLVPLATRALYNSYASTLTGQLESELLLFRFSSNLSSIQDLKGSTEISARVFGEPTLLRGQVMVKYECGNWSGINAKADRDTLKSANRRFTLRDDISDNYTHTWRIEPVKILAGPLAVPAGATEVVASLEELELDPFDGIVADNEKPYQVVATGRPGSDGSPRQPMPDTTEWEERYLQLPEYIEEPLRAHAHRILKGGTGNEKEIVSRLESYLGQNGSYEPDAEHSRRRPILHFLEEGELRGHCEYFATTLTLLLRSVGIPARYIIGYNAAERNELGDYLLVRDRDAHAWVEAYVDGKWIILDPTPAAERAQSHPEGWQTPTLSALWDYAKYLLSGFWRWVSDLEEGGPERALGVIFAIFFCAAALFGAYRFRNRLLGFLSKPEDGDPIQSLGKRIFLELGRRGLTKEDWETPLEFAQRLRELKHSEVADWLESYVRLRFREAEPSEIEALEAAWKEVPRK